MVLNPKIIKYSVETSGADDCMTGLLAAVKIFPGFLGTDPCPNRPTRIPGYAGRQAPLVQRSKERKIQATNIWDQNLQITVWPPTKTAKINIFNWAELRQKYIWDQPPNKQ